MNLHLDIDYKQGAYLGRNYGLVGSSFESISADLDTVPHLRLFVLSSLVESGSQH